MRVEVMLMLMVMVRVFDDVHRVRLEVVSCSVCCLFVWFAVCDRSLLAVVAEGWKVRMGVLRTPVLSLTYSLPRCSLSIGHGHGLDQAVWAPHVDAVGALQLCHSRHAVQAAYVLYD